LGFGFARHWAARAKPGSCTAAGWTLLADSGVSLAGVVAALFAGKPGVTLQNEI
jgi:hypothetical protein